MRRHSSLVLWIAFCLMMLACGDIPKEPVGRAELPVVDASSYVDKVTVGYQGWFLAEGDGSPVGGWKHWAGSRPAPGNVTFELYPDVRDYAEADLYATDLGVLGDGRAARLFSSHSDRVVDTHFRWMSDHGIDGAALQRFVVSLYDGANRQSGIDIARAVRSAAEAHGRIFHIEYDLSSANADTWVEDVERDWQDVIVGQLGLTASSRYARQNGRPVVTLWGLGFADRPYTAERAAELVAWLKAQGCFVVGGVPYTWRTGAKERYLDLVYPNLDLIQPWAVGSVATDADVSQAFADIVASDVAWTSARGIHYQRVIYPGFAWSNWNGGARNAIPRRAGRFLWAQARAVAQAHVGAFVAMFDEYDEGTAIAKAAENTGMTPTSQYFLTLDADGYDLSSDFYLRLTGAATRMIKGQDPVTVGVPVPPREGRSFGSDTLGPHKSLSPGGSVWSVDGRFHLDYQGDGNLVLYQEGWGALWSSQTAGTSAGIAAMQGDGNVVVYDAASRPLWSSGTSSYPNAFLRVQTDGNLVVYDAFGAPLWASNTSAVTVVPTPTPTPTKDALAADQSLAAGGTLTSADGRFHLTYQGDGNLVLSQDGVGAIWASHTAGRSAGNVAMQGDGNLVIYDAASAAVWASGTAGHPGARLVVQSDGNVVVYNAAGVGLWSTGTAPR